MTAGVLVSSGVGGWKTETTVSWILLLMTDAPYSAAEFVSIIRTSCI